MPLLTLVQHKHIGERLLIGHSTNLPMSTIAKRLRLSAIGAAENSNWQKPEATDGAMGRCAALVHVKHSTNEHQ